MDAAEDDGDKPFCIGMWSQLLGTASLFSLVFVGSIGREPVGVRTGGGENRGAGWPLAESIHRFDALG